MVGFPEETLAVGSLEATVLWIVVGLALSVLILATVFACLWVRLPEQDRDPPTKRTMRL